MSILEYMLANQKQKEDLGEGYVDVLKNSNTADFIKAFPEVFKHSNTYKLGAGIGNLAKDAASGVSNFVSDITFNPLPYGESIRNTYDGIQNLYGNTLDRGLDNVIDYFSPNPTIISGGPLSNKKVVKEALVAPISAGPLYDANMPGTMMFQDNFIPKSSDDRVYYQETDTGPEVVMSGALSDKPIDQIVSEYMMNDAIDMSSRKNYGVFGDRVRGGR